MRNMSFALTTAQVQARTKTVTRRLGWKGLKPGTLLQPVVKGMGLKKGQRVERIGGPIRVLSVRREPLDRLVTSADGLLECQREGFPELGPCGFVTLFLNHNRLRDVKTPVTRIEFEYVEARKEIGA